MSQSISEPTTGEYDAINFDGLERRANYRTIAYREDILHILEHKDAAAIIYQIISRWQTEIKRPQILKEIERRKQTKQPPLTAQEVENMMWVYMSYNDFVRESGGAVAYNTVIRMMHYLVNTKKVVEQRENHDPRYPDYEYRINKTAVKELLKALPTEPAFSPKVPKKKEKSTQEGTAENDSTQEGTPPDESTQMGTDSTQEGIATTQMGTEVYPNGGTSHITHNYTHNYNTEEEREIPSNIPANTAIVSSDTAHAEYPLVTFANCLNYLQEQGVAPRGDDAVEVMMQARTLYAHKHPRYEYRARPGLSELSTDQLPSKQNEQLFTNEPQGDDHATASGYPHRLGDAAAPGDATHHAPVDDGHVAVPEGRPVLEAQEVAEKGGTSDGLEHDHSTSNNHLIDDHAAQGQVAQTPTTSTPAQSLSSPQAEQAALGARGRSGKKPAQPTPETPKCPPVEPPSDMAWGTRKCLMWFDFWRGGILIGKWKLMQASTCAKGLAEQFDEQTVIQARTDMEADPYYAAKGGCDVCDVANNIHKYLKRRQNKKSPNVDGATSEPLLSVKEEFDRYWGINEKRVTETRGVSYATA